ncbi:uncharacterized protein LOC120913763 [Rana temporaria]|uniref:uncharacterized protein LOC120913763 n=1 Tax=Rana temporaria TaxID=8407 RepID=UPI001AAD4721|nr:uncharacterized protein LOC120913763 [Rana temporaria]
MANVLSFVRVVSIARKSAESAPTDPAERFSLGTKFPVSLQHGPFSRVHTVTRETVDCCRRGRRLSICVLVCRRCLCEPGDHTSLEIMDQPPGGQESPYYEETLARSRSGSSSANYSSDLFESTSDESSWNYESDSFESLTNDPVPNYESDTFESYSHVKSHDILFSETTSIISEADEEVPDRNNTENDLIKKWITILVKSKLQSENSSRPQLSPGE